MKIYINKFISFLGESIEELFLILLILLNIFDFLEVINPDIDYIKKVISFTAAGFLIYQANLSKIFFGKTNKRNNLLLIISYFLLSSNKIIGYSLSAIREITEKGSSYWASLEPIIESDILHNSKIIEISTHLHNQDLTGLQNIPIGTSIDNLTTSFKILPTFPPTSNEIIIRISNDISYGFFKVIPKFFIHPWHNFIIDHSFIIQKTTIILGFILILYLSIKYAVKETIKKPSLMNLIEEEGKPPKSIFNKLIRILIIFVLINFFYIAVFNLTLEWLAMAVDAPILVMGIFFYFFIWLKHHKKFSPESLIFRIGNFGEKFYENYIKLFYTKKGVILGLSGMLVLHLLTDIGNFIVPYIIGIHDALYFNELGIGHTPLFSIKEIFTTDKVSLFFLDINNTNSVLTILNIMLIYIFNILTILFLFIGPGFIWYILFKNKEISIPNFLIALFYGSLTCFILMPLFKIGRIASDKLVGVDILTQPIIYNSTFSIVGVILLSLIVMISVYLITLSNKYKPKLILGSVLLILAYFGMYVYNFFIDTSDYYIKTIAASIKGSEFILAFYLLIFLTITIVFYLGGFFCYIYECLKS